MAEKLPPMLKEKWNSTRNLINFILHISNSSKQQNFNMSNPPLNQTFNVTHRKIDNLTDSERVEESQLFPASKSIQPSESTDTKHQVDNKVLLNNTNQNQNSSQNLDMLVHQNMQITSEDLEDFENDVGKVVSKIHQQNQELSDTFAKERSDNEFHNTSHLFTAPKGLTKSNKDNLVKAEHVLKLLLKAKHLLKYRTNETELGHRLETSKGQNNSKNQSELVGTKNIAETIKLLYPGVTSDDLVETMQHTELEILKHRKFSNKGIRKKNAKLLSEHAITTPKMNDIKIKNN